MSNTNIMPAEANITTPNTEELLVNGQFANFLLGQKDDVDKDPPEFHTFRFDVSDIQVVADFDVFLSLVANGTGVAGVGEPNVSRVFVPAATPMAFSWRGRDIFFVNAVADQDVTIFVTGFAIREDSPVDV